MSNSRKTGLVVLFNHNYEKNIPIIRKLYADRFPMMCILMPFYYGNDPDVTGVYGNSFVFHTYIAQAKEKLMKMGCDDFLIIGDDLLLNPELNQNNIHEKLNIPHGAFYLDGYVNISSGQSYRAIVEAVKFNTSPPGLDSSANRIMPSYDEALQILQDKKVMGSPILSKCRPFYPEWEKPFFKRAHENYKVLKARVWHFCNMMKWKLKPRKASYPCVFGYSDIILVPKEKMDEWCRYLEVMATWQMFVELAIPTAIFLMKDASVSFADATAYKTGNVWYPQNPAHFSRISAIINQMLNECGNDITGLEGAFPKEYLYLHPVKLSRFA